MKNLIRGLVVTGVIAAVATLVWMRPSQAVQAQDNLTPGMLFGPLSLGHGEHLELCFANLSEGSV